MQSQVRRYLVLGGAGLAVVLMVLFFFLRGSAGSAESTCNKFIDFIIDKDAEQSYAMFSDDTKKSLTPADWAGKMQAMEPSHYQAKYNLQTTESVVPVSTDTAGEPIAQQLIYSLSSPPLEATASCQVSEAGNGLKVKAYAISPVAEGSEQ